MVSRTLSPDLFFSFSEAGRKAIKLNNGLQLLYRFCNNCPEDKSYDSLLSRICGIINQCLEKKELPVPEMSPARWTKHSRSFEIHQRRIEARFVFIYCILIVLSDRSNYLKKKKQLRSKNSFFSNSRNSNSILRDSWIRYSMKKINKVITWYVSVRIWFEFCFRFVLPNETNRPNSVESGSDIDSQVCIFSRMMQGRMT